MARPNLPPLESSLERLWDAIYKPLPAVIRPPLLFDARALSELVSDREGGVGIEVSGYLDSMQCISKIDAGFRAYERRVELVGFTALQGGEGTPSLIVELARSPVTNRITQCDVSMSPPPVVSRQQICVSRVLSPSLGVYELDSLPQSATVESEIEQVGVLVRAVGDIVIMASKIVSPEGDQ